MSEFKRPIILHLYNEGEFIRTKEARTKKEYDQMILNGYIEEPKPSEYPKALYKKGPDGLKDFVVQNKEAEAEARKAGFGSLHEVDAKPAEKTVKK